MILEEFDEYRILNKDDDEILHLVYRFDNGLGLSIIKDKKLDNGYEVLTISNPVIDADGFVFDDDIGVSYNVNDEELKEMMDVVKHFTVVQGKK